MVTTTFTTSGMVLAKVGTGVSTALTTGSTSMVGTDVILDLWIVEAEAYIVNMCRYDFVSAYAGLDTTKKKLLQEIASSFAAVYAIQYDMAGFSSRLAAEDKINILNNAVLRGIGLLKEDKTRSFMGAV